LHTARVRAWITRPWRRLRRNSPTVDPVDPAELRIGTYLLTSELVTRDRGDAVLKVALVDAWGNHLRLTTEDIQWTWPKGFETTPYPCDRNLLCVDVPDPRMLVGSIGCIQDITCIPKN